MNKQEAQKLENKILEILKKYFKSGDIVIAGISGGPDSVFLLQILKLLPIKTIVAHINHSLRKAAESDEKFVKNLSKNLRFHFESLKANIKSLSQKFKQGLEETGRKIRYDFFKKLARKHQAKFIVTAHHADDNLETTIFNFTRGASLQGLCGMEEIEPIIKNCQIFLLRPFLSITKNQIFSYLKFKKIPFCIDKSNNKTIYKRNFIRHKIIPELKKLNPNLTQVVAKNIKNIREINNHITKEAHYWIAKNLNNNNVNIKNFRTLSHALQKIIILEIYKKYIGNVTNLGSKHLTEVLTLINRNIGNKRKKFGKLTLSLKNNIITFNNAKEPLKNSRS